MYGAVADDTHGTPQIALSITFNSLRQELNSESLSGVKNMSAMLGRVLYSSSGA